MNQIVKVGDLSQYLRTIRLDDTWALDMKGVTRGNRRKFVATAPESESPVSYGSRDYYWKASIARFPLEFWSEVLAFHIGTFLNVPVPITFPSTLVADEAPIAGSLAQGITDPTTSELLVHGGDLLSGMNPSFDRTKGEKHSYQAVKHALDHFGLGDLLSTLTRLFIFDALIGNSDRHQENWALVCRVDENKLGLRYAVAPAFDNGSSLLREVAEDKLHLFVTDSPRRRKYIEKGTPHLRWEEGDMYEEVTHLDLLKRIAAVDPGVTTMINEMTGFDPSELKAIIHRVCAYSRMGEEFPEYFLSSEREKALFETIIEKASTIRCSIL